MTAMMIAAGGCVSTDASDEPELGPVGCPESLLRALVRDVAPRDAPLAAAETTPDAIGLTSTIASNVACVVRVDSTGSGAQAAIIMRSGFPRDEARHGLWDEGFDGNDEPYSRTSAAVGTVIRASIGTYGSFAKHFDSSLRLAYPPDTVVLVTNLRVPQVERDCTEAQRAAQNAGIDANNSVPTPTGEVVICREAEPKTVQDFLKDAAPFESDGGGRHCVDTTSYDYNWQNDVLCTREDGSRFYTDYGGADAFLAGR